MTKMSDIRLIDHDTAVLSVDSPLPRAIYADTLAGGAVLITIQDGNEHVTGQLEVTFAEFAAFGRIVADMEWLARYRED